MSTLRRALSWLSSHACDWSVAEAAQLGQVAAPRAAAYCVVLARERVLIATRAAERAEERRYRAGPRAAQWRDAVARRRENTYGHNADYRRERALREAIETRDWDVRRGKVPESPAIPAGSVSLTCQEAPGSIADDQEAPQTPRAPPAPEEDGMAADTLHPMDQAAARLGVSATTLRRLIQAGRIGVARPSTRTVRVPESEIARYLTACLQPATAQR